MQSAPVPGASADLCTSHRNLYVGEGEAPRGNVAASYRRGVSVMVGDGRKRQRHLGESNQSAIHVEGPEISKNQKSEPSGTAAQYAPQ